MGDGKAGLRPSRSSNSGWRDLIGKVERKVDQRQFAKAVAPAKVDRDHTILSDAEQHEYPHKIVIQPICVTAWHYDAAIREMRQVEQRFGKFLYQEVPPGPAAFVMQHQSRRGRIDVVRWLCPLCEGT